MNTRLEDIALAQRIAREKSAPHRTLADALAAEHLAMVRIHWNGRTGRHGFELRAYSQTHQRIPLDDAGRQLLFDHLRATFPSADLRHDWDWHLGHAELYPSPQIDDDGAIPELDGCFGSGPDRASTASSCGDAYFSTPAPPRKPTTNIPTGDLL